MTGNDPDRGGKASSRALRLRNFHGAPPEFDEATQQRLGRLLARSAELFVRLPIPDVFLLLLARMEAKERGE